MVVENPESIVELAGDSIIQQFTPVLRNMALDAGWPDEIISSLSLTMEKGTVNISYPEKYADKIKELEFASVPPKSVLRTFVLQTERAASKELFNYVMNDVATNGGVL